MSIGASYVEQSITNAACTAKSALMMLSLTQNTPLPYHQLTISIQQKVVDMVLLFFSTILISLVEKVCNSNTIKEFISVYSYFQLSCRGHLPCIYIFLSLVLVTFFYGNWDYGKNIRCTLIFFYKNHRFFGQSLVLSILIRLLR